MIFHQRLTELRKEKWASQKECAKALGVDPSKYNKWENGKNCPDFETVCTLAKFFETTTDYLFGVSDVRHTEEVKVKKWQLKLSDSIENLLNKFFVQYEVYENTEDSLEFEEVFFTAIVGGFKKVIDLNSELLKNLNNLQECRVNEISSFIENYKNKLDSILYKNFQDSNGVYATDISSLLIVNLIIEKIEENYPEYRKYRREFLNKWAKKLNLH